MPSLTGLKRLARRTLPAGLMARLEQWRNRQRYKELEGKSAQQVFGDIYRSKEWNGAESVSGPGSDLKRTESVRAALPGLLRELGVRSILDAPCGDFHWMKHVDLSGIRYIGGDIVQELIETCRRQHASSSCSFEHLDLTSSELPRVDLVLVRDCLIHLSFADIAKVVANLRRSGSTYLLTTTFPGKQWNIDIATGGFRPVNLERPPFNFPAPLRTIAEDPWVDHTPTHSEDFTRCLGLWRIADLPQN
jgi:hypothetical protein